MLKKYISLLFLALSLLLSGCTEPAITPAEQIKFTSNTDLKPLVPSLGSVLNYSFTAASTWTIFVNESWVNVSPMNGEVGSANITIKTSANSTHEERSATILIKCGDATKEIFLTQEPVQFITVTNGNVNFGPEGGFFACKLTSNINYSYTISVDWIKHLSTKAVSESSMEFYVEPNMGTQSRVGSIIFKGEKLSTTITIHQNAAVNEECIPELVDLGLSVKWASFNVGATKPEEFGGYYAWGETEEKTIYDETTHTHVGYADIAGTQYDVAHVKWGDAWRMPTIGECVELISNCNVKSENLNGISGSRLTSKKNGNSIFLPYVGLRTNSNVLNIGEDGRYWTSSLANQSSSIDFPYAIDTYAGRIEIINGLNECYGHAVRPVYGDIKVTGVSLSKTNLDMSPGETYTLYALFTPSNASNQSVTWSTSDRSVASVDQNGNVTAISSGISTITAQTLDGGYTATCEVTVSSSSPSLSIPEIVDLGLSVKWASFNLGATKPEEFGDYYAWGETETHYLDGYAQSASPAWKPGYSEGYTWSNYLWCRGNENSLTKYNTDTFNGTVDQKKSLDPTDDVAYVKLNGQWRMPSHADFYELSKNCTWLWTTLNGVKGYKVTSTKPGYTDKWIFLPAAGDRINTRLEHNSSGYENGYYWTNDLNDKYPSLALLLYFNYSWVNLTSQVESFSSNKEYVRSSGRSIRPVYCERVSGVTLNTHNLSMIVGNISSLSATFSPSDAYNKTLTWASSSPDVVTVDQSGKVTAVKTGSSTITVVTLEGGYSDTCTITVTSQDSSTVPESVDLGLSVKWATYNIGATKPEEYGDYYSWGEIDTYYQEGYAQEDPQQHWKPGYSAGYSWENYKWCNGSQDTFTKYKRQIDKLEPADDVAYVRWGDKWRMPTAEEMDELVKNCNWTWTTLNGIYGYKVSGKKTGYTDKWIFLPAAGDRFDTKLNGLENGISGWAGRYWSSSIGKNYVDMAQFLIINKNGKNTNEIYRNSGHTVRPVTD